MIKSNKVIYFYLIISFLFGLDIKTYIDPLNPKLGDSFSFFIEINNAKNISNIVHNNFLDNFIIISGPNKSTSNQISIVNGSYTQINKTILEWRVSSKSLGKQTIPSINLKVDGKNLDTQPVIVNVLNQSQSDYFVESELSNQRPYRGEQIILSYIFYSRTKNIYDINFELPDYNDFWHEKTLDPKKIIFKQKIKNNQKLYYFTISELALFPTKSGHFYIDPIILNIEIPANRTSRNNNSFGNFFSFNTTQQKTLLSEPIEIDVIPLPNALDATSNIGEWDIIAKTNSNKISQNDALTFEIELAGIGNLDAVNLPEIKFPPSFDVFDPEIEKNKKKYNRFLGGQKIFKYVLIPREQGNFTIPEIEFIFFNTKNEAWESKITNAINIDVIKSNIDESYIGYKKNEVELIQQDIRFVDLKKPKWVTPNSYIKSNYIIYQLLIITGLLLFPYLYGYMLKIKTDSNRILIRKFNSTIAKLELKDISLEKKCDLFNDAIIDLINYKKNQNFNYYSNKQINTIFSEHKISIKLIKEVNSIFSQIQEYNFSKEKQVAHDFLCQSEKLIKSINDEWIK